MPALPLACLVLVSGCQGVLSVLDGALTAASSTPSGSPTPVAANSSEPTATPVTFPSVSPTPAPTESVLPAATPSPTATATPVPTASASPVATPVPTPSPDPIPTPTPETNDLLGVVTVGGFPRAGALLQLSAEGFATRQTVSGQDGSYRFVDVPPGTYVLVVKVNGAITETRIVTVK